MKTAIARKELMEMLRDGRFRVTAVIVVALVLAALWMGWKNYSGINREHTSPQGATRRAWLNQGVKNPHSAAHYGVYAFKPKLPLSLVDPGTDPYTGVAVWLEAHKQDDFQLPRAGRQHSSTIRAGCSVSFAGIAFHAAYGLIRVLRREYRDNQEPVWNDRDLMRVIIKMVSSLGTGHFYTTTRNPKTQTKKLELQKFDPIARKRALYRESKA